MSMHVTDRNASHLVVVPTGLGLSASWSVSAATSCSSAVVLTRANCVLSFSRRSFFLVGLCSADSPPPRRRILRCSQILVRMMARDGHVTIFIREHRSWREFAAVSLKCMCRSSCTKGHPERTLVRKTGPCFRNPLMHALHEQAICGKTAT